MPGKGKFCSRPRGLDLSVKDSAMVFFFHRKRSLVFGTDGSFLEDGDCFIGVRSDHEAITIERIDYFHGILHGQPVCQTQDGEICYAANEMISLVWPYGFCFRRVSHLQRRFRSRRAERYAMNMYATVIVLAKCVVRQRRQLRPPVKAPVKAS